jgi:tetratricopeptide (TPR) repeat protein
MPQPFNQGPRLSDTPSGDPSAQAIASLRGYAYQLYASGLAWLDLRPGQELYLEVAQDYAVATREALRGVQVKDTTANVTINSEDIRDVLDGFVDLVERNPGRKVHLRFLSTCAIGREQKREHRANGESSLIYWRRAAAGAEISPLREVLKKVSLSDRARSFIDARDDVALRDEFLRRIQWDCGQSPIEVIQRELENGLLQYHVERFQAAARRDQLAAAVVQQILATIIQGGKRHLTDGDLLALVTDTSSVLVPRAGFEAALQRFSAALGGGQAQASLESVSPQRLLEPERELPLPPLLAERDDVTRNLLQLTRQNGVAFVTGGTGCGKTTVARLTTRAESSPWCVLDLRENSAEQIAQRLEDSLGSLGASSYRGIILDDLNEIEDPIVRRALARFLSALGRRDMLCLITAYRRPSSRTLSEIGLNENAHLAVPDLSLAEIATLVTAAGGEGDKWPEAVRRGSAWGHPQCVQAIISGLRKRGWPAEELKSLLSFSPAADLDAERLAARSRIVAILSADTRRLLYRISILFGRFDRSLALSVGAIDPAVPEPGAQLDQLIGPWVELAAQRDMRVSPLLENAGGEILTPEEIKRVHEAAAQHILGGNSVGIDKANFGFLHALLGEQEWLLMRLAYNIITTSPERCRELSEWMGTLRQHRLDQKIYPTGGIAVSILLRLAQFLLIAANATPNAVRNCWRTLQAELTEIGDAEVRERLEYMIVAKALFAQEAIAYLPDTVGLILRFAALSELDPDWRATLDQRTASADGRTHSILGTFFITYALHVPSVPDLQRAFDVLQATTPGLRAALLNDVSDMPGDAGYIVNHAWLEESKRQTPHWPAHLAAYGRMAEQAQSWGYRDLSIRCHIVRGIILDEYLNDHTAALGALGDAEKILGTDPALDRARAKIFYRRRDHEAALRLYRERAGWMELREPVARTYMLREAAISAAELGQWAEAREWFAAAHLAASNAASTNMKLMAIGLRADEGLAAYKAGDVVAALNSLSTALDEIAPFDPASSIAAGYRHRVIRHSILWIFSQATENPVDVEGKPTVMVPGMCSNPEPTDLSDMPFAPPDYARYLLVQAEIASGVSAGIEQGVRAHFGGRAIPNMEISVRGTRMEFFMRRLEAESYIAALSSWVDSQVYLDDNRHIVLRSGGPQNPVYGEIPTATATQLLSERAILTAEDALLSFGITAVLQKRPDALVALCAGAENIEHGYPGKKILSVMASGQSREERLPAYVAVEIHRLAYHAILIPDELFVANVRFVQWAKKSNLQKILIPAVEAWARAAWAHAIEEQQFNLRSPATSVFPIREVLASGETGLNFMGKLIISAQPAVHHRFDQTFRDYLLSL